MKNFKNVIILLMVGLSIIACKKDDDGGDAPAGGLGTFSAKVDGVNFVSLDGTVTAQMQAAGPNEILAVSAGTVNSENLQFIIQNFTGEGTYQLDFISLGTYSVLPDISDPNSVIIYTTVTPDTSAAGEVNISSYDGNSVAGTFSFTGYRTDDTSQTVAVTEGAFNVAL